MLEPLPPDPYKALDVPADAQFDVIKKRYRELVLKCHPDKCPEADKTAATDRFAAVQNAWEILGDTNKRQDYHKLVKQHKMAEELARSTRQAPAPAAGRGPSSSGYYGTSTHHSSPQTPYGFSRSSSSKARYEWDFRSSSDPAFYETDPRSGPHASRETRRPSSWDEDRSRETDRSARDRERDRDRERERERERDRGRGSPSNRDRDREREDRDRDRTRGIKRDDEERQRKLRSKEAKREEKERIKENEKQAKKEEARIQRAKEEEKLKKKAEAKRKEKERAKLEKEDEERRASRKKMEADTREMRDYNAMKEKMRKVSVEDDVRPKKTPVMEDIRSFPEDFTKSEREHERHRERSRDRDSGRTKEERRSSRSESKRQNSSSRRTTYVEDAPTPPRSFEDSALTKTQNLPVKSQNHLEFAKYRIMTTGGMPTQSRAHASYADHELQGSVDYGHRPPKLNRAATDNMTGDFSSRTPKFHRSATEKVGSSPRRSQEYEYDGYGGTSPSRYFDVQGTPFGRAKFGNVDTRNPTTSSWGHVETSHWDAPEYSSYNIPESRSRYRSAASYYN